MEHAGAKDKMEKNRKNKASLKDNPIIAALILFVIATVVTLALAGANELTKDTIVAQAKIDEDNARLAVFPQAASFEELSADFITGETPNIKSAHKALDNNGKMIGLVAISFSRGYAGDIEIMSGISLDRVVYAIKILSDNETPGLGKKVGEASFISRLVQRTPGLLFSVKKTDQNTNVVDAVTGATISSKAVVDASNSALDFAAMVYARLQTEGGN